MTKTLNRLSLAIAGSMIAAAPALGEPVTAVSSTVSLGARAVALPPGGLLSFDSATQSWGVMLDPMSASVSATDFAT